MIIEHLSTVKTRISSRQQALYCLNDQGNENRIGIVECNSDTVFLYGTNIKTFSSKFANELEKHERVNQKRKRKDANRSAHFAISFSESDKLSSEEQLEIAKEAMEKLFNISNRKYLVVEHHDTKNPHFHFVMAWRDNDGKALQNSNWKYKGMNLARELEKKHDLIKAKTNITRKSKHRKCPEKKEVLEVMRRLMNSGDHIHILSFYEEAKKFGVNIDFSISKNGRVNGWKFEYKGIFYKASDIDRSLSWTKAQKFFLWDEKNIKDIHSNSEVEKTSNTITGDTKSHTYDYDISFFDSTTLSSKKFRLESTKDSLSTENRGHNSEFKSNERKEKNKKINFLKFLVLLIYKDRKNKSRARKRRRPGV